MENREIDRLIVKHVLQIPLAQKSESFIDGWLDGQNFYSTYIGDAWRVVEKLRDEYYFTLEEMEVTTGYKATFYIEDHVGGTGKSINASMAICKAALKTVGIEIE